MAVIRRPARRDYADELRHVDAARVLVHEVAELPIRRRGQNGLVGVAHGDPPWFAHPVARRRHGDHDQRLRRLDCVLLPARHERAGPGLEGMTLPPEVKRAGPRDDEQDLLPAVASTIAPAARPEADHPLLAVLPAVPGADRRSDLGCIARCTSTRNVLLRNDEAL